MDSVEDFLSITFEEAQRLDEQSSLDAADPRLHIYRWVAAQNIDGERQNHESGDKTAILAAVAQCARGGFVMPKWLVLAFLGAYRKVVHYEAKSWDDVLGTPLKKRQRLSDARRRRELMPRVYVSITEILRSEPNTPIDDGLFERVGELLGGDGKAVGKTLVKELWYKSPFRLPR